MHGELYGSNPAGIRTVDVAVVASNKESYINLVVIHELTLSNLDRRHADIWIILVR